MDIKSIIKPESVFLDLKAKSKKQVLNEFSRKASELIDVPQRDVFDALLQREKLGTTALGKGIAIPHAKLKNLSQVHAFILRFDEAIDFEALDERKVDLFVILLAPVSAGADHLKALAKFARVLRDPEATKLLRGAENAQSVMTILDSYVGKHK